MFNSLPLSVHKKLHGRGQKFWRCQSAKLGRSTPLYIPLVEALTDHVYNSLFWVIPVIHWTEGSFYNLMEAYWSSWMVLEAYKWFWEFMEPFRSHCESFWQDWFEMVWWTHRQTDSCIELHYACISQSFIFYLLSP